jgi:hypothetical protein
VGWPAVQAILGTRVIPGLLDRWLAFKAYKGQEGKKPVSSSRQDNLYESVPGDHGAHGRFDRQAVTWSAQLWLDTHRWTVMVGALILAAGVAARTLARRGQGTQYLPYRERIGR